MSRTWGGIKDKRSKDFSRSKDAVTIYGTKENEIDTNAWVHFGHIEISVC